MVLNEPRPDFHRFAYTVSNHWEDEGKGSFDPYIVHLMHRDTKGSKEPEKLDKYLKKSWDLSEKATSRYIEVYLHTLSVWERLPEE